MTGIILSIVAIICFLIAFIIDVIHADILNAVSMLLLILLNLFLLQYNYNRYKNHNESQEIQTTIVKDIQGFSVDSTLTISGADTTKTYTLTYWK